MKKLFLLMLSSLLLVNCTKHSFDGYNYATKAKEDFTQKFVKTFGEPASDQDWGFDGVSIVDLTSKASTRGHNVNRNEWEGKFILPPNVTEAEENAVLAELRKSTWVDITANL